MSKRHAKARAEKVRPFILRAKKSKRPLYLADPDKLATPVTTRSRAEAYDYVNRNGGLKMLTRHPKLRRHFRCTRAPKA